MLVEPAHTVDVDGAVIHPDALPDCSRLPEAKEGLVDQVDDVAHFSMLLFLLLALWSDRAVSEEFTSATGSLDDQPVVAVSESSLRTRETRCCSSSSEL